MYMHRTKSKQRLSVSSMIKTENDTEGFSEEERDMSPLKETHTEVKFSLKKERVTAESITIKKELDDFDYRETLNEFNQDLDEKSTIKSEEETFINGQYMISHEEVTIKSEDDVEQSDSWFRSKKVKDQIKTYKCSDCPYEAKTKESVKRHSVRHKKPEEIVWHRCTECPYKTARKDYLKLHAVAHNEPGKFKIFKCAHCDYESPKKQNLKRHLPVHQGENIPQIQCPEPECPYKTNIMSKLKRHSLVHRNDKFFKCTQCPYEAKHRVTLNNHQLTHENTDKWHACPQCPYRAIRKFSLKKHLRTHSNPVQFDWYTCEQCPYKTNIKYILNRHALTHNIDDTKWLQCTCCSYKTMRKFHFLKHQILHQNDDVSGWQKCPEYPYKAKNKSLFAVSGMFVHNPLDKTSENAPNGAYRRCRVVPLFQLPLENEMEALPSVTCENTPRDWSKRVE